VSRFSFKYLKTKILGTRAASETPIPPVVGRAGPDALTIAEFKRVRVGKRARRFVLRLGPKECRNENAHKLLNVCIRVHF